MSNKNEGKRRMAFGLLLTGAIAGAGATLIAVLRKQHKEQVYREAEIKAMDELDDMLAEDECGCDTQCGSCDAADVCGAATEDQLTMEQQEPEEKPSTEADAQ